MLLFAAFPHTSSPFCVFSVDGDPHFVIDFPSSKLAVCFNIDGQPGDILRLVSDHKESGKIIGNPAAATLRKAEQQAGVL